MLTRRNLLSRALHATAAATLAGMTRWWPATIRSSSTEQKAGDWYRVAGEFVESTGRRVLIRFSTNAPGNRLELLHDGCVLILRNGVEVGEFTWDERWTTAGVKLKHEPELNDTWTMGGSWLYA